MKKLSFIIFICFSFLISSSTLFAQTMGDFFKKEGVRTLAELAHPSNTFKGGRYEIEDNHVIVTINYTGGINTKLKLYRSGHIFTGINVLYDNDWFPPFGGTYLLKEVLMDAMDALNTNQEQEILAGFEGFFKKKVRDFSGEEFALLIMTGSWIGY